MALNLNKVFLSGRICNDIELKQTNSGLSFVNFRLAVSKPSKKDETDFFDIVSYRKTAEFISKYFSKGSAVFIEGCLSVSNWEEDGKKRSRVSIVANDVNFVESKSYDTNHTNTTQESKTPQEQNLMPYTQNEDSLPF